MPRDRRPPGRPFRRRGPGAVLVAVAVAIAVAACNSTGPSGSPVASSASAPPTASAPLPSAASSGSAGPVSSGDLAPIYAEISAQVRAIRGLDEKQHVEPTVLSPDEMHELISKQLASDTPPAIVGGYERLYHAMGVLPKEQKLSDVYVDLLSSQVGGLYVPSDKKLYVVSKAGGVGPLEKFLYSHEYTHELQDQNFDLAEFQPESISDQSDRQMARQALVEGDAYVTMTYWLQQHMAPTDVATVMSAANDPEAQAALQRIPPIISSQILFAALEGTVWVLGIQIQGGYSAVDALFADPPDSTEQVLHPDKWASREKPIEVKLPSDLATRMGSGWSVGLQDTFGEHQLGTWISQAVPTGGLPAPPPEAVVGWGGDRVALLDGPSGAWAVAIETEWDTDKDAAEFEAGIGPRVAAAGGPAQVLPGAGGRVRWIVIGSDDAVLTQLAGVLGLAG